MQHAGQRGQQDDGEDGREDVFDARWEQEDRHAHDLQSHWREIMIYGAAVHFEYVGPRQLREQGTPPAGPLRGQWRARVFDRQQSRINSSVQSGPGWGYLIKLLRSGGDSKQKEEGKKKKKTAVRLRPSVRAADCGNGQRERRPGSPLAVEIFN